MPLSAAQDLLLPPASPRDQYQQCNLCGHVKMQHSLLAEVDICAVTHCKPHKFEPMVGDMQTCLRRVHGIGPWDRGENLDIWWANNWNEYYVYDGRSWPIAYKPPRTCSFCGGANPEDAIQLMMEGWEVESTGKDYKRYLHPPGYESHMDKLTDASKRLEDLEKFGKFIDPSPPVKLYTQHFTPDHIAIFNALLSGGSRLTS